MKQPLKVGYRVYLSPTQPDDAWGEASFDAAETDTGIEPDARIPRSPITWETLIREQGKKSPPDRLVFAVRLIEDDSWIGVVNLAEIDWINRTAETGSFLKAGEYRGRGYGTEAKMLLLEYAFDHLHLHLLYSVVLATNERSAAALAKQGYKPAGRTRYEAVKDGVYVDDLLFDLTRDDWVAARDAWRRTLPDQ
ncbi:MAG: GNAT family N-acetyltransferase [Chloroflexota bacterium]